MKSVATSPTRPKFQCAACELVNDCGCLDVTRLLDLMAPLVRQVLEHLATDGSFLDYEVCEQLAVLVDRNDQRECEIEAMPELGDAEDLKNDRVIMEDLVACWGYEQSHHRTPEGVAGRRKVPVQYVRGLLDRFLRDSRPEPACAPEPIPAPTVSKAWPAWAREVDAAVERRVA